MQGGFICGNRYYSCLPSQAKLRCLPEVSKPGQDEEEAAASSSVQGEDELPAAKCPSFEQTRDIQLVVQPLPAPKMMRLLDTPLPAVPVAESNEQLDPFDHEACAPVIPKSSPYGVYSDGSEDSFDGLSGRSSNDGSDGPVPTAEPMHHMVTSCCNSLLMEQEDWCDFQQCNASQIEEIEESQRSSVPTQCSSVPTFKSRLRSIFKHKGVFLVGTALLTVLPLVTLMRRQGGRYH